ncbi:MAG: DsbA family oxidoreductase [Bacteroidia bacterium]|nr:DsbA family oxidoreductase [Bacteroidia bacterium]
MMKPVITIDIVSDIVCPWCYIGEARLKKAMEQSAAAYDFAVTYHPFELNPHMPEEGKESVAYFSERFGGELRMKQIFAQTAATAHDEGLELDLSKQAVAPNTFLAHRLVAYAKSKGKQLPVVHELFLAYFTKGKNMGDINVLTEIAATLGLDKHETETILQGNDFADEVSEAQLHWRKMGISSVPSFIIQHKYLVQGAQPPESFLEVFSEVVKEKN